MTVRKKEVCSKQSYATAIKYMSFCLLLYCVVKTGFLCLVVENWRRQEKIGVVNRTRQCWGYGVRITRKIFSTSHFRPPTPPLTSSVSLSFPLLTRLNMNLKVASPFLEAVCPPGTFLQHQQHPCIWPTNCTPFSRYPQSLHHSTPSPNHPFTP